MKVVLLMLKFLKCVIIDYIIYFKSIKKGKIVKVLVVLNLCYLDKYLIFYFFMFYLYMYC